MAASIQHNLVFSESPIRSASTFIRHAKNTARAKAGAMIIMAWRNLIRSLSSVPLAFIAANELGIRNMVLYPVVASMLLAVKREIILSMGG